MGAGQISFGPFLLDRGAQTLLSGGKPVALGQRAFALLDALAGSDGPVEKAALIEAAWPGTIVEDGNLTVQIAALRKALGSRPDGQEWIVTVPRVGYRLLRGRALTTEPVDAEQPVRMPSIAVLPFQNMSGYVEQDYFADGVVEDIITALSRFRTFAVTSRNSSFAYKGRALDVRQIGRELGARYVLEGSVRRAGKRLRITAQLIDSASGSHLWAENFDGVVDDVFDVQDTITQGVAAIVEPMLKRAEIERARSKPPSDLDAYDLYLQALSIALVPDAVSNARTVELIERSLAIDPDFAPAMAVAATAYLARFDRQLPGVTEADRLRGVGHARAALAAAGNDANVRAVAGLALMTLAHEFDTGIIALRQAVAENPNNINLLGYAGIGALHAGTLEEAETWLLRAMSFNTRDLGEHWNLGGMAHIRMVQGRFEEALDWATRSHAVNSQNHSVHWMLAAANAYLGRMDEAVRWREALQRLHPGVTLSRIQRGQLLRDPRRIEVIVEGLRLAGLPE